MANGGERPEVFREHFKECLAHFAARFNANYPPGKKGLADVRRPIAEFCGVAVTTVQRWLSSEMLQSSYPVGDVEIKLKCFLDLNGYRIIEFERLPKVLRNIAELIGYSVMSADEISRLLGYSRSQNMYPVLRADEHWGLGKTKESMMFDLWKEKKSELEQKKKDAAKLCRYAFLFAKTVALESKPTQLELVPPPDNISGRRRLATLTILDGALQLLEEDPFNDLSETEWSAMRDSHHGSTILKLSAHLSALSSRLITGKQGD